MLLAGKLTLQKIAILAKIANVDLYEDCPGH